MYKIKENSQLTSYEITFGQGTSNCIAKLIFWGKVLFIPL